MLKTYAQFKPVANLLPVLTRPAHLALHQNSEKRERRASFYYQINTGNIQLEVFVIHGLDQTQRKTIEVHTINYYFCASDIYGFNLVFLLKLGIEFAQYLIN